MDNILSDKRIVNFLSILYPNYSRIDVIDKTATGYIIKIFDNSGNSMVKSKMPHNIKVNNTLGYMNIYNDLCIYKVGNDKLHLVVDTKDLPSPIRPLYKTII